MGVGDDAALVALSPGHELVITTDMLVAGTHFFADTDAQDLGHKALAVNLSDLAAMGAKPRWVTLALSLPQVDQVWLEAFAGGFFGLAEGYEVDLVGGDTTRGPLNICVTALGEAPAGRALLRSAARAGDDIWVSGNLGEAALGLAALEGRVSLDDRTRDHCLERLHRPVPRVSLGLALRDLANAAIDVSDGLLADLGHIVERSNMGAEIELVRLPRSASLAGCGDAALAEQCLLGGGDDYELCFTAGPQKRSALATLAARLGLPLTRIGRMVGDREIRVRLLDASANEYVPTHRGFDHFASGEK